MLTKNDLVMIGGLLKESNKVLEDKIDGLEGRMGGLEVRMVGLEVKVDRVGVALKQLPVDIKHDIREELRSATLAMKREIIEEISEFIGDSILPQIADLQNLAHWHGSDGAIVLQKS